MQNTVSNILLVEDNPGDARLVIEMLKESRNVEFKVLHVETIGEAKDILFTKKFDTILLDLNLPDSNGIETIKSIKKYDGDTPVVVLTGQEGDDFSDEAMDLYNVNDYLLKGELVPTLLIRTVKYVIERNKDRENLIHERKKALQYLNISGVIIVSINRDGDIELANKKALDLLSDGEDIVGKKWIDNYIPANNKEKIRRYFELLFLDKGEKTIRSNENHILTSSLGKRLISWRNTVVRDENGDIKGLLCAGEDITEKRKLANEIQEQRKEYKELYEIAPSPYQSLNDEGKIILVNKSWLDCMGYEKQEVIGKSFGDFFVDDKKCEFIKNFDNFKKTGAVQGFQTDLVKKDGSLITISLNGRAIYNEDGEIKRTHCIFEDITKFIEQNKELKRQEDIILTQSRHAAMGEMISMIAHQWRQPISTISMGANNILIDIELGILDEESVKTEAVAISEQTDFLSKTIDDFRDFFKPNKEKEEVNIKELIESAFDIIGKSLEHNDIDIIKKYNSDREVVTYSRELLQVFINILNNAKEALIEKSPIKRKIEIELFEDDNFVSIKISDNAGGIPKDVIKNIFEPYFTTKTKSNGTGLGLYMGKTIVQKHLKGEIDVENTNEGASFLIKIPIKL